MVKMTAAEVERERERARVMHADSALLGRLAGRQLGEYRRTHCMFTLMAARGNRAQSDRLRVAAKEVMANLDRVVVV